MNSPKTVRPYRRWWWWVLAGVGVVLLALSPFSDEAFHPGLGRSFSAAAVALSGLALIWVERQSKEESDRDGEAKGSSKGDESGSGLPPTAAPPWAGFTTTAAYLAADPGRARLFWRCVPVRRRAFVWIEAHGCPPAYFAHALATVDALRAARDEASWMDTVARHAEGRRRDHSPLSDRLLRQAWAERGKWGA